MERTLSLFAYCFRYIPSWDFNHDRLQLRFFHFMNTRTLLSDLWRRCARDMNAISRSLHLFLSLSLAVCFCWDVKSRDQLNLLMLRSSSYNMKCEICKMMMNSWPTNLFVLNAWRKRFVYQKMANSLRGLRFVSKIQKCYHTKFKFLRVTEAERRNM